MELVYWLLYGGVDSSFLLFFPVLPFRRGLITRNVKSAVDLFHQRFGVSYFESWAFQWAWVQWYYNLSMMHCKYVSSLMWTFGGTISFWEILIKWVLGTSLIHKRVVHMVPLSNTSPLSNRLGLYLKHRYDNFISNLLAVFFFLIVPCMKLVDTVTRALLCFFLVA